VVFISSHGSPREFDTGGVSYVITYDTDAATQDALYGTALEMIEIVDALSTRVKAQRGVLFLDTCFSGAVASGFQRYQMQTVSGHGSNTGPDNSNTAGSKSLVVEGVGVSSATLDRLRYSVGRVVITASQPDERSWESESLKNGYFTYCLIQGLKQNNGKVCIEQLYRHLKHEVPKQVNADKKVSQSPMMLPAKPAVEICFGLDTQRQ
jgi:uncharacterized caspase-like protein